MNKKDKQEPNNPQSVIEDLTVNEDQAAEVKGGPYQYGFSGTYANAAYNGRSE